jgi:hypothetical protein
VAGAYDDIPVSIETDDLGNTFVAGNLTTSCDFSGTILVPKPEANAFLASYNDMGKLQFAKLVGGTVERGPSVDNKNDLLFIKGDFSNPTITFDNKTYDAINYGSDYIAYYKQDGTFILSIGYSVDSFGFQGDIVADGDQGCFVAGSAKAAEFGDLFSFGGGITGGGVLNQYVAKVFISDIPNGPGARFSSKNLNYQENAEAESLPLVYPNPARETLQLKLNEKVDSNSLLIIMDIQGRRVWRGKYRDQIDVSSLAPGTYTLEIQGLIVAKNRQAKFVKE